MSRLLFILAIFIIVNHAFAASDTKMMLMLGCLQMEDKNYQEAAQLFEQVDIVNYDNYELWKMAYNCAVMQKDYKRARFAALQLFMIDSNAITRWYNLYETADKINDEKITNISVIGMNYCFPDNINLYDKIVKYYQSINDKDNLKIFEKKKYFWLSPSTFSSKYSIQGKLANDDELINLSAVDYRANQALSARYWNTGKFDKAIEYAYLAYKVFPGREDNVISLSSMLAMAGRLQESADIMKSASSFGYLEVEYAHGYLAYALGRYKDSADSFRRLRNRDILNLEYCIHEGGAAMAAGDDIQAYNTLKVSTALYKDINLDFLYISILLKMKKYEDAYTYIKDASETWGDNLVLKLLKVNILLKLKKYSEASDEGIKLVGKAPELSGILYYCGMVAVRDNNLPIVEKCAKQLVELSDDENDNVILALHLFTVTEMIQQARIVIGKILADKNILNPKKYDFICKIAEIASGCGMWNEAIMAGNELIKINPNDAQGYIFIGVACEQLNRMNEASGYYRKAENLNIGRQEVTTLLNYYAKTGSFDDALRVYKAKVSDNINEDYYVTMGDYMLGNGDAKGAENCWMMASLKYPDSDSIRSKLRLYNLHINEKNINASVIEKDKDILKDCYIKWKKQQMDKNITALKKNSIPFNDDDLTKLLNLQLVSQEYSALLK